MWNGGRKEEIHGFYWNDSVDDVNRIAIGLWDVLGDPDDSIDRGCEENVDGSRTDPGEPFQGFTTLYGGQASCLITVSPVKYSKENCGKGMDLHYVPTQMYGIVNLKRILKSRQISYKAGDKKDALAKQLYDYLSVWIPATWTPNSLTVTIFTPDYTCTSNFLPVTIFTPSYPWTSNFLAVTIFTLAYP